MTTFIPQMGCDDDQKLANQEEMEQKRRETLKEENAIGADVGWLMI